VRRQLTFLVLALAAASLLSGCATGPPVPAAETAGTDGRQIQVLVEQAALGALGADIHQFLSTRDARISWGGGTADAIVATVKDGYRVSVVVLPSGPALERVRDELVAPPTRLGRLGSATYWACPVDQYGLSFVRFLTGRTSQRVLRSQGFDVSPSP
jgi:ABC-type molybdate transport system substrate-binding protein